MSAASTTKRWSSIVSLAVLGTNRSPPAPETLWPDAGVDASASTPEATLLRAAAANYLWQLAGLRAPSESLSPSTGPAVEWQPAPQLEEKLVSEPAAWRLTRMLNGEYRDLVPEWFALAKQAGRVLPPQWIPVVLDVLKQPDLASVAPVLGRRAVWLAARNPAWELSETSAAPSEDRWINGTLNERLAELTALRAIDPNAARRWVESTWKVDPPDAREAFLQVLMTGLSSDDEPFLEAALDDKRKAVRSAAVACLARLPHAAHAKRNLARLEPLLTLKKRRLDVQLPTALEKSAVRDGIEANPPANRKIGERAWWLVQMVSIARPSVWTERFACDPATFIEAVGNTEYALDLSRALADAATRHADTEWIALLASHFVSMRVTAAEDGATAAFALVELVGAAPPVFRETLLAQLLDGLDPSRIELILALLNASNTDWSADTTRRAFKLLEGRVRNESQEFVYPRSTLSEWALRADVTVASSEVERIQAPMPKDSPWRNAIDALTETLEFRAAMRQELLT